jgi:outer membrane autotransporter protein
MIKLSAALATAFSLAPAAALAGPYANVETNAGFLGSEYQAATTDVHVGYESTSGDFSWYLQGGPAILTSDEDSSVELSGKVGASVAATEKLSFYGELSGITGDDENAYGLKAGAKYSF